MRSALADLTWDSQILSEAPAVVAGASDLLQPRPAGLSHSPVVGVA